MGILGLHSVTFCVVDIGFDTNLFEISAAMRCQRRLCHNEEPADVCNGRQPDEAHQLLTRSRDRKTPSCEVVVRERISYSEPDRFHSPAWPDTLDRSCLMFLLARNRTTTSMASTLNFHCEMRGSVALQKPFLAF